MTVVIIALVVVLVALWYAGLYYRCAGYREERTKQFDTLKSVMDSRGELIKNMIVVCGDKLPDCKAEGNRIGELVEKSIATTKIDERLTIEKELSGLIKRYISAVQMDSGLSKNQDIQDISDSIHDVERYLSGCKEEFDKITEYYNYSVNNFLIRITAKVTDLYPAQFLDI